MAKSKSIMRLFVILSVTASVTVCHCKAAQPPTGNEAHLILISSELPRQSQGQAGGYRRLLTHDDSDAEEVDDGDAERPAIELFR
eukprot:scaffold216377_cov26-Prasinocladus_malaysianus.AAC.1